LGIDRIERGLFHRQDFSNVRAVRSNITVKEKAMSSPEIANALLALEKQEALSLPVAALVLGVVSQVESLIDLADRVWDQVFSPSVPRTTALDRREMVEYQTTVQLS
jgi:hypothetical protein